MQLVTVKYQIANYNGDISFPCDENDEEEMIIAKAKRLLKQKIGGSFPLGYQYWSIENRIDV